MRFLSMRLSLSALFRLVALTARVLVTVRWWPHTTDADTDASVAWYRSTVYGKRTYHKIVNSTEGFTVELEAVPGYSRLVSYYNNGRLREESEVYVSFRTDGVHVERERVRNGKFYAPDGAVLAQVTDGDGTLLWTRANGLPFREITLATATKTRLRQWFNNGHLWFDQSYRRGDLDGESREYYPNGKPRSLALYLTGQLVSKQHFDTSGKPSPTPDASERAKFW